jgi:hypothetical protein
MSVRVNESAKDDCAPCHVSAQEVEEGITSGYSLSDSEVQNIKSDSNNAGHFASNLVKGLFPELFGIGNYKHQFNWYGGGKLGKKELCRERKALVRQYVVRYYPEHKQEASFKDCIYRKSMNCNEGKKKAKKM